MPGKRSSLPCLACSSTTVQLTGSIGVFGLFASFDKALEYVGVLAIEFFVQDGRLIANEVAPRVHNSGHWTLEGAQTSQFANHLRAVTGLPLGSAALIAPTAMLNLIGQLPDPRQVLALSDAHLHLYGKQEKAGRKLGHLTLRSTSSDALQRQWDQLQQLLPAAS